MKEIRRTLAALEETNRLNAECSFAIAKRRAAAQQKAEALPPFRRYLAYAWLDLKAAPVLPTAIIFSAGLITGIAIALAVLQP